MLRSYFSAIVVASVFASPANAATQDEIDQLLASMRISDLMQILREEGVNQAADISNDMFPDRAAGWSRIVSQIYDPHILAEEFSEAFGLELQDEDITGLNEFFGSDRGQRIVEQELRAREALLDPATEEAAKAAAEDLRNSDPRKAEQIDTFIEENDLVELNVMGGLNSSLMFFDGLAQGETFEMSQEEVLALVWAQEDDIRADASNWLPAYFGLAFHQLEASDIDAYVALSKSDEGADLNRAVFAGYNQVFSLVSRSLGIAAAQFSNGEDI